MERLNKKNALKQVVENLKAMICGQVGEVCHEALHIKEERVYQPDLEVEVEGYRFVVECKKSSQIGVVANGIGQLLQYDPLYSNEIPLLAVPYMSEAGIKQCEEAGISWLDLSGNADVTASGLRLYVRGKKNKFTRPGRKENPFAPKSSRVARRLLYQPEQRLTQRELTDATSLSEGLVSRVVKALEAQRLVARDDDNRLWADNASLLLDAWSQGYDFSKHELVRGHVAGRSGEEVQRKLSTVFSDGSVEYAATGLGAAWLYSQFATFRTVSFYLQEWPDSDVLEQVGFREVESGANVWLIIPKDEDVFFGVKPQKGVSCVHPIQVWLDLKAHPERAEEAAEELRRHLALQKTELS
ncbi:MAG: hypothetical protein KAT62_03795 [Desulfuromonadales bacterium]|nr:hypothetical protein [Desulfuromonadales bacterium]